MVRKADTGDPLDRLYILYILYINAKSFLAGLEYCDRIKAEDLDRIAIRA